MPQSSLHASSPYIDREVICLTQEGIWLADGEEITHEPTRKLFARSLKKDEDGYFLSIGLETKRIQVEDTAYFVERIDQLKLTLSDGTEEILDYRSLRYSLGRLTAKIKEGTEEAKFLRAPYHDLLKDVEESKGAYYLTFNGERIFLGGSFD